MFNVFDIAHVNVITIHDIFTQLLTCHVIFHPHTYGSIATRLLIAHTPLFAVCHTGHVHVGYWLIDNQLAHVF